MYFIIHYLFGLASLLGMSHVIMAIFEVFVRSLAFLRKKARGQRARQRDKIGRIGKKNSKVW